MLDNIPHYHLPEGVKKAFTAYVLEQGAALDPYKAVREHPGEQDPLDFRHGLAFKLKTLLQEIPQPGTADHQDAQKILAELEMQRRGRKEATEAFVIDNLPIDPNLPSTPQSKAELPVGEKNTFVSEAIHIALLSSMGMWPYLQPGMQGSHAVTQVIPFPGAAHEQSNQGGGVLALHTENSTSPGHETPEIQSLIGLRGGDHVPVGQTIITTLVPVDMIMEKLSKEDIRLLSLPIFHYRSGPAIAKGNEIDRIGPIITTNRQGKAEFRIHTDPVRMEVVMPDAADPRARQYGYGAKESLKDAENAREALQRLREICDVQHHPDLNASAIRIDPGVGLFWHNRRLLHGRGDIQTLLESAVKGESYSAALAEELFHRKPEELKDEYDREKRLHEHHLEIDTEARWVQRMRGRRGNLPDGIVI